jgi:hypothetical protein
MYRSLLGAAFLIAAGPAMAAGPEMVAPIQAVMEDLGGKQVLAYYTRDEGRCDLVLMTGQEPGPRVRVTLAPDQAAAIEDVGGGKLSMTCGAEAAQMRVERSPALLKAADAR